MRKQVFIPHAMFMHSNVDFVRKGEADLAVQLFAVTIPS